MGASDTLDDLQAAVEAAGRIDWAEQPLATRVEAVERLARIENQIAAVDSAVVDAYRTARDWQLDGHRTPAKGVQCQAGGSAGRARRRVARAKARPAMPVTFAALAAGDIGVEHQTALVDALAVAKRAGHADAFERDEKLLADMARTLPYGDFKRAVDQWAACVDPDGADADAIERGERRDVACHQTTGGYELRGWLTPFEGAEFNAEFERVEQHLFQQDWADARHRLGDKATKHDLARTGAQRRHDALIEMARRSAQADIDGLAPAPKYVVNVHTDWDTFCAELARHQGNPYAYGAERLCELEDGSVIPPSFMLSAALQGEVRRIVWGADGHVVDYGRARRLATGALREAVFARDRTCAHPACGLPARRCELDHQPEWTDGGRTREQDLQPRCDFHNRWKTSNRSRWRDLTRRHPTRSRRWDPER